MIRNSASGQSTKVGAIREVRARMLSEHLSARGYLIMDSGTYKTWEQNGCPRRALDQAIEDLVVKGEAKVETFGMTLEVTPVSEGGIP